MFQKGEDYFNDMGFIDKRCPECETKVEYGVTTEWSDEHNSHVCKTCGTKID